VWLLRAPATKLKARRVNALAGFFARKFMLFPSILGSPPSARKINALSRRVME
jgi:hypothetical protein